MTKYDQCKKDSRKTINYLVKQFEMKKSADEYRRAALKTGNQYNCCILTSTMRISSRKLLFLKVKPWIDRAYYWSGSMSDVLLDTLKQINLVWFCKS